jgi:hypothetical protein
LKLDEHAEQLALAADEYACGMSSIRRVSG